MKTQTKKLKGQTEIVVSLTRDYAWMILNMMMAEMRRMNELKSTLAYDPDAVLAERIQARIVALRKIHDTMNNGLGEGES